MSEYMNEDDYTALIGAIADGMPHNGTPCSADSRGAQHRIAVHIAKSIRDTFALTRKPAPLPDAPGAVVSVPLDERWSSLYVLDRDGEWHLSSRRIDPDWLGQRVARHGSEVVA